MAGARRVGRDVTMTGEPSSEEPHTGAVPGAGVRNVVAGRSGQGSVGKTTVAGTWPSRLRSRKPRRPRRGDIYIQTCRSCSASGGADGGRRQDPPHRAVRTEAIFHGLLTTDDSPVIWRGRSSQRDPAVLPGGQLGRARLLVVDMPPGTGDVGSA